MSRTNLIVVILVALVCGMSLGLAAGVLIGRFPGRFGHHEGGRRHAERGPMVRRESMLSRFDRALDLETQQRERIVVIFERARLEHEAARESMKVAIDRELTPAQRERWKQIESRFPRRGRGDALAPPPDSGRP